MSQIPEFEKYPFKIDPVPADEGGGFVITFPDLPGCISDGATYEETIVNGRDAFQAWMEAQLEDGKRIPEPHGEGAPAKFVQRLPQSMHAQVLARAAVEGVSMNMLVTIFVAEGLGRREARQSLGAVEDRVARILQKLHDLETRATVGSETLLLKQESSGYQSKKGRESAFAQSSGNGLYLAWSRPKEASGL